ncbi:MAG: hypothetical protein NZM12_12425, partial [Steroidobacteraceae bacterium]|nr:hypothetical protein [Steroidobacteraceae bacterium]MDW8258204.1 hypothetical protein [Gammaproteobacteria bacterium]
HTHEHDHRDAHLHSHTAEGKRGMWGWALFIVFLFGPCEPLVPLVLVPASQQDWVGIAMVTGSFVLATIATMLSIVIALRLGLVKMGASARLRLPAGAGHFAAGVALSVCGGLMLLGL